MTQQRDTPGSHHGRWGFFLAEELRGIVSNVLLEAREGI